jgi:hypothetical protein
MRRGLGPDFVLVLAGMVGVGGLFGVIAIWTKGIRTPSLGFAMADGLLCSTIMVTIGFLMVSVISTHSIAEARSRRDLLVGRQDLVSAQKLFLNGWWRPFRLVLLLAIGPALIALEMATTYRNVLAEPKTKNLSSGAIETTSKDSTDTVYLTTTKSGGNPVVRRATPEEVAALYTPDPREPSLIDRLSLAVLVVLTVLAHGAAATGVGLASGLWIRRRGRAIATAVGTLLIVIAGCPICVFLVMNPSDGRWLSCLSPVRAIDLLLIHIGLRSDHLSDVVIPVLMWDISMILAALGLLGLSLRASGRGHRRKKADVHMTKANEKKPTRDPVLVGK